MWRAIFPLSSTQSIYPKNSIEQVIVVVKVHEQSHFLMYFQHVYFADVCHVLCLPSLGHALSLPLQRKAGVDKGWGGGELMHGQGMASSSFSLSSGFPGLNLVS